MTCYIPSIHNSMWPDCIYYITVLIHRCVLTVYNTLYKRMFFFFWRDSPQWAMAPSFARFLDHTQRHITVGRTPLDEWSARRRDLYLTTHNTHNRPTSMPPGGIRTHNLSRRAATDSRLRPRGHWDWLIKYLCNFKLGWSRRRHR